MKVNRYKIEIWCGRATPERVYDFIGTRQEARAECRKHTIINRPVVHGTNQIAHINYIGATHEQM